MVFEDLLTERKMVYHIVMATADAAYGGFETACGQQHGCSDNQNAITHFDIDLNIRQKNLLQQLPDYDSSIKISKGDGFKRFSSANGENG